MTLNKVVSGFLAFVLVICMGVQPVSARLNDVPNDHWAYQAVVSLVNKGYLAVFEDGTFQGTRSVDRYTLAVTLARILDEIEAGRVSGVRDDATLLRELTTEFREELVQWYAQQEIIEDKLSHTQRVGVATEDRLNRIVTAQVELQEEVTKLKADIVNDARTMQAQLETHGSLLTSHDAALASQEAALASQEAGFAEHEAQISKLQLALDDVDTQLRTQAKTIATLENWTGEKGAVLAALTLEDTRVNRLVNQLFEEIASITEKMDDVSNDIDGRLDVLAEQIDEQGIQLASDKDDDIANLQGQITNLLGAQARTDGESVRSFEQLKVQISNLSTRNQEIEQDLQNLAVRLARETQTRTEESNKLVRELAAELNYMQTQIQNLEAQVGFSDEELAILMKRITDEVSSQMNATFLREQRLERQLKELQEDFAGFKTSMEEENKSLKGTATIAMVAAGLAILVGFIR